MSIFFNAFNQAVIGMALVDLEGQWIKVNLSLCEIFGYSEEEFLRKNFQDMIYPDDVGTILDQIGQLIDGQITSYETEKRCLHKQGNIISVIMSSSLVCNDRGEPLYCIVQLQDITHRKLAEEKLRIKKESYQRLVEESPDAVIIVREGEILYINEAGIKLLSDNREDQLVGRKAFEFVHPDFHEVVRNYIEKEERGENVKLINLKLIRVDGQLIEVELKVIPTIYQGKSAIHVILRDTSERKKVEELLVNSEKLSIAGQLAAGIAHEIRNPLTAIRGFVDLMKFGVIEPHYFDIINSEFNRIEEILNELLLLAKPQLVKYERENIQVLLNHVYTLLDSQANMNNILISMQVDCLYIECAQNQMKQVFINLLKNAMEAMPNGGEIAIHAQKKDEEWISIQFVDQGCGIPEEQLKRIGQPFFSTKEKGTGLGLMTSKKIIEDHGGTIHITSKVNEGTTIEVYLPMKIKRI
jgi:two-component system sporulation sensor kinase A